MNLGGGGCSELRLYHCTPAWATQRDSISKKKKIILSGQLLLGELDDGQGDQLILALTLKVLHPVKPLSTGQSVTGGHAT